MSLSRTRTVLASSLAVLGLVLASCGDDSSAASSATAAAGGATTTVASVDPYGAPATTAPPTSKAAPTTAAPATTVAPAAGAALAVKVSSSSLGNVLVDGSGRTLYVFTKDEKNKSNCTGGCLGTWPPLNGTATAGTGVDASKLGTITGSDGKQQATIDGQPLYYFAADASPGDVKGQNVGTAWFVVDGTGVIKK
jgi:predicted lipoprotein with Yx(FWY)xxD motif